MLSLNLFRARTYIKLMLCCGLLQIAAYYFAGSFAAPGRHLAVPQPDTLLYFQSARQVSEGMPFVYTPGEKPSTGSTTHLYPFVLALLYKAGATGDALITAGFVLNALFYLIFLANWGVTVRYLGLSPSWRLAACLLLAVNGHAAYGALSQSDVGFFMVISSGLLMTLVTRRIKVFAVLLAVAPWCRPEGAILAVCFAGAQIVRQWGVRQRVTLGEWWVSLLAVVSVAGVFAFNFWLTGHAQFESVLYKGYFKTYGFFPAVHMTLRDVVAIGSDLFLGVPSAMPRAVFFLPLLGALFAWIGVMARPWRRAAVWKEIWWLVACAMGMGVVASSGWQNTNMDRYFSWLLPIWLVYTAGGAVWIGRRFPRASCRALPFLVVVAFQGLGAAWLISNYYAACLNTQQAYEFAKEVHAQLPEEAKMGGLGSFAYAMQGRRFVNLHGIYTPELLTLKPVMNMERLKHRAHLRFDYWGLNFGEALLQDAEYDCLSGQTVALGADGTRVRVACWDALDRSSFPISKRMEAVTKAWRLVERLDVGYAEDEERCGYEVGSRFHGAEYEPFALAETNRLFEVGRAVIGWESMTVRLAPGQPVLVVLRTSEKAETEVRTGISARRQKLVFASPLKLRVHVDGREVGVFEIALPATPSPSVFCEISFTLPAGFIRNEVSRLTVYGDHSSFGYWFYQPE